MMKLAIVSPCYNEEEILEISSSKLSLLLQRLISESKISPESFVLYVNDGSKDRTWEIITSLHKQNPMIKGLNLSHNVGHQQAIMAGMMTAKESSDAVITIDADLQDDLNAIEKMLDSYESGHDIVYGVKVSRQADPILKRLSAVGFYNLQRQMGIDAVFNHADFRLMSKRALDLLAEYKERNLYLRGLIPMLGLPSAEVEDEISERSAGSSKYSLSKMLNLALDGITSFSIRPILIIANLGFLCIIVSLLVAGYVLYEYFTGGVVPGWSSLMISIWFVGGLSLLSMGVIGVYVGKVYKESKQRPLYNIMETLL